MKVHEDCFPCFIRQSVIALRLAGASTGGELEGNPRAMAAILAALAHATRTDISTTPAHGTTYMHRAIREALGVDPYRAVKDEYNHKAMALYPSLKTRINASEDPLHTAVRIAVAGNVIDFGIYDTVDIEGTVERALTRPLEVDEYAALLAALKRHDDILYLLDNTGEAVFDRLLIETLTGMGKRVTAVAKGGPIINDATMEDARAIGLDEACEVIDNGTDCVGTILELSPPEFVERFRRPGTLIISKGQGNFETLLGDDQAEIIFLFQSKCEVVARVLGLEKGSMLIAANRAALAI